ncbi:hypothetical protein L838_4454 [Mycobacterium avium MAV_120709_2344]|uniref:hypothetical protein n=1 Tax=Mycobacterium avium TaxID=1764 RepID=UPI00044CDAB5|nr:hypothetical protein [Mycobacterium avium]ETZ41558.1 hypothetical protein L838_4454 [Mycobacterium avium MAV_120709_2344]
MVAEDFGKMLDLVVQAKSLQLWRLPCSHQQAEGGLPLWVADPAVGWYNELDEITAADGDTDEVEVTRARPLV